MQIIAASEINNGSDKELRQWVEKTVRVVVVPQLLGELRDVSLCMVIYGAGMLLKSDSEKWERMGEKMN